MPKPLSAVPTPWTTVLIVCGRCARKMENGYGSGHRQSLRSALREALRAGPARRSVRVVDGKCFGICPAKATVVLNASQPGELLSVPRRTPIADVLERLGLGLPPVDLTEN